MNYKVDPPQTPNRKTKKIHLDAAPYGPTHAPLCAAARRGDSYRELSQQGLTPDGATCPACLKILAYVKRGMAVRQARQRWRALVGYRRAGSIEQAKAAKPQP